MAWSAWDGCPEQRFIGEHDWYREGAEALLKRQDRLAGYWRGVGIESNPQIATAFALLFLSKGRRPVLIAKLKHDEDPDWNRHRHDLAHLTQDVERRWRRDLTWQTIHGERASVTDLLETPVLYISGRDQLRLSAAQKRMLREYVDQGGFVFAEACCEGEGFDRDFRQLASELFPDSPLRLMPPDHPVWFAEERVPAEFMRPLYGIDSCCRTAVIYCPGELSCYWELADRRRLKDLPDRIRQEVRAVLAIGANVLTYATNRQLKDKLEPTEMILPSSEQGPQQRGTFYVAKLSHAGGSDDAPAALSNLLRLAGQQLQLRINSEKRMLPATDPNLPDYPVLFLARSSQLPPHASRTIRPAAIRDTRRFCIGRFDLRQPELQRVVPSGDARDLPRSCTATPRCGTPPVDTGLSGIRHHHGAAARASSANRGRPAVSDSNRTSHSRAGRR